MTLIQLQAVACSGIANAQKFLPYLNNTCDLYSISTPVRQLSFLSQLSHESGGLFYTEELASGTAYEGRADLGNNHKGDGMKFKGRGLIQITGRNNYSVLSAVLHQDFISDPSLLGGRNINACSTEQLKYAAISAGWFWNKTNLSAVADNINLLLPIDEGSNLEYFKQITRRINGGYNGLPDRLHRFKAGLQAFNTQPNTLKTIS